MIEMNSMSAEHMKVWNRRNSNRWQRDQEHHGDGCCFQSWMDVFQGRTQSTRTRLMDVEGLGKPATIDNLRQRWSKCGTDEKTRNRDRNHHVTQKAISTSDTSTAKLTRLFGCVFNVRRPTRDSARQ